MLLLAIMFMHCVLMTTMQSYTPPEKEKCFALCSMHLKDQIFLSFFLT